jgi:glycerol uptake facilitator-like aquaporin
MRSTAVSERMTTEGALVYDRVLLVRHAAYEGALTLVLLFAVTGIVRWGTGPSALADALGGLRRQLVAVGVAVGLVLVALICSPPGRASGGHLNPAVSLAMWRFGVFPGRAVPLYIAAQLAGSLLGVLLGRAAWGPGVALVHYAAVRPAPGWDGWPLLLAETATTAAIIAAVGVFLSSPRLGRFVPYLVGALVGLAIAGLGAVTGGSANPARQFGPALVDGQYALLWIYLLAPMLGALIAAWPHTVRGRHRTHTHHLAGHRGRAPSDPDLAKA